MICIEALKLKLCSAKEWEGFHVPQVFFVMFSHRGGYQQVGPRQTLHPSYLPLLLLNRLCGRHQKGNGETTARFSPTAPATANAFR